MEFNLISYFLAIIVSFFMGLAIQQGGTCTVAAVREVVKMRTANRIAALIETAIWVFIGELILAKIGIIQLNIDNWMITSATFLGATLLGIGAFTNGACAVGTIAKIGNKEWDYLVTIPGFFCGAATLTALNIDWFAPVKQEPQPIIQMPTWVLASMSAFIVFRLWKLAKKGVHPYAMTLLIGILFLFLLTLNFSWSYTDLLIDIVRMKSGRLLATAILFCALVLGSVIGGALQNNQTAPKPKPSLFFIKRFIGGYLMGMATLILPGSHDSLILLYMPMLLGYAWVGFMAMILTIFLADVIFNKISQ